jgi:3-hydroxyisobutyrate dehydrogenase-like beta-hydroxyacid dehydrogenase
VTDSVGIIGAGRLGQAMARTARRAGRDVVIANSRGPAVGGLEWNGQIVIDATNDWAADDLNGRTSSELVASSPAHVS